MTEYELQDLLTATSLAAWDVFAYYLTILASYLVATHLVGGRLSTLQAICISVLFVFGSSMTALTSFFYMSRAVELANSLELLHPGRVYGGQPFGRNLIFGFQSIGIIVCLSFMWQVRHPKEERPL